METIEKMQLEKTLQMVKEYLPEPGTELGCYAFLAPEALWTGEAAGMAFVAVADCEKRQKHGNFYPDL